MSELPVPVLVALGGAAGAAARYAVGRVLPGRRATLVVNVLGSLLVGVVAARVGDDATGRATSSYALLATGFCGAFTTFSAFALDSSEGEGRTAARTWTAVVTLALCVTAALLGRAVGLRL